MPGCLYNQTMEKLRNRFVLLLLALLCLLALHGAERLAWRPRLWLGGVEISGGGTLELEQGTAEYDPESGILRLCSAAVKGSFRGAAIYAEGDLVLLLEGESLAEGADYGVLALGDLTIAGDGSITLTGSRSGAGVRGCVTVFDRPLITLRSASRRPLRWARLHTAPNVVLTEEPGLLKIMPPCLVTILDGIHDAAGHELPEDGAVYPEFLLPMGGTIPEPEAPEREGYWFGGWYADEELTVPFDFTAPLTGDTRLYIRWIQIVRISFDSWGGSEVPDILVAWGDPCPLPEPPVREGWDFIGWYTDKDLTVDFDPEIARTMDRTLYARWEKQAIATGRGIDVARYQGEIDWQAAAAETDFVFIRLGYRGYGSDGSLNLDLNFAANMRGAMEAGLDVGVYFFSQAVNEAEALEEAEFVLGALQPYSLTLPVILDYEIASTPDGNLVGRLYEAELEGQEHGRICAAFCRAVEARGYTAGVYAGKGMLEEGVAQALEEAGGFPVWLANWVVQTRYNGSFEYWQYSGGGTAAGVTGSVDLDIRYITEPAQVTGLSVQRRQGANRLAWNKVPGARGYIIYRQNGDGTYAELTRVTGASVLEWTDLRGDDRDSYLVCAYVTQRGRDYCGPASEAAQPG